MRSMSSNFPSAACVWPPFNQRAKVRTPLGSMALTLLTGLFLSSPAPADIIVTWDTLSSNVSGPIADGNAYSLGNDWTAKVSNGGTANGIHYTVGTPANSYQTPMSGSNFVYSTESFFNRDNNPYSMIVLSPFFTINTLNPVITMAIAGGGNGTAAPTSISGIGTTLAATTGGWQGVVLLDANGNVLQHMQHSGNGADWQTKSFSTASLTLNTNYQLAMIDTFRGGWGWIALDNVSIAGTTSSTAAVPEPTSIAFLAVGGISAAIRRKKRGSIATTTARREP